MSSMTDHASPAVKACLNILQTVPPQQQRNTLAHLKKTLRGDSSWSELMNNTGIFAFPLEVRQQDGRSYIVCSETFHRSGSALGDELQRFEGHANEVWQAYTKLYYGSDGAIGSVYIKDDNSQDHVLFQACFLVSKTVPEDDERMPGGGGIWNSTHIWNVSTFGKTKKVEYRVNSSVWLSMQALPNVAQLGSHLARETVQTKEGIALNDYPKHLEIMGTMMEFVELELRGNLEKLYIPKTRQVVEMLHNNAAPQKPLGIPTMAFSSNSGITRRTPNLPPGAVAMPGIGDISGSSIKKVPIVDEEALKKTRKSAEDAMNAHAEALAAAVLNKKKKKPPAGAVAVMPGIGGSELNAALLKRQSKE